MSFHNTTLSSSQVCASPLMDAQPYILDDSLDLIHRIQNVSGRNNRNHKSNESYLLDTESFHDQQELLFSAQRQSLNSGIGTTLLSRKSFRTSHRMEPMVRIVNPGDESPDVSMPPETFISFEFASVLLSRSSSLSSSEGSDCSSSSLEDTTLPAAHAITPDEITSKVDVELPKPAEVTTTIRSSHFMAEVGAGVYSESDGGERWTIGVAKRAQRVVRLPREGCSTRSPGCWIRFGVPESGAR